MDSATTLLMKCTALKCVLNFQRDAQHSAVSPLMLLSLLCCEFALGVFGQFPLQILYFLIGCVIPAPIQGFSAIAHGHFAIFGPSDAFLLDFPATLLQATHFWWLFNRMWFNTKLWFRNLVYFICFDCLIKPRSFYDVEFTIYSFCLATIKG